MPPYIVKASEIKLTVIDCKNGMECAENHNITIGTFKIRRFFNEKRIISSVLAISMLTLIISVCAGCSKNDNSSDNSLQTAIAENNAKQYEQKQFIEK